MKKIALVLIALSLFGCSKLTKQNYDAISVGMGREEVSALIGSPDNCSKTLGTKSCIWGDENGTHIKVSFVGDAAVTFSNKGL